MFNNIRLAEGRDTPYLIQLCKNAHLSSPYSKSEFNPLKVLDLIDGIIKGDKSKGIILVATDDLDNPIGLLMASTSQAAFNYNLIAQEIIWWVEPLFRKSHSGMALYKAFNYWADQINCTQRVMSTTDERLDKFYKRQGYSTKEVMYIKGL